MFEAVCKMQAAFLLLVCFKDGDIFWSFSISESGLYLNIPEPSTYAAVIGAIALAFAVYRRRK